ncbi:MULTISPECIES: hypothetical protein [unclassified Microcoleus]|uniref:hypothetical protein n=1 Tax=unclassified Microcoleus TaxID=2642155 RepID=UPI0025DD37D7|nr:MULTISPECIES: hypothetical protein [unclassified Microcoleus]
MSDIKFCRSPVAFSHWLRARSPFECYALYQRKKDARLHRWAFEYFQATIDGEGA